MNDRPCTCHPDDNPPVPCPKQYALSECRAAAGRLTRKQTLPTDSAERKEMPLFEGCLAYFPAALAGVALHSKRGNDKHNPGEPLHHARGKSMDHADCVVRHLMDLADLGARAKRLREPVPPHFAAEILDEANALAWRALALAQELHEVYGGAPLAPGAVDG